MSDLAPPGEPGQIIAIQGVIRGADCAPIPYATVEVWQADAAGAYHDTKLRAALDADGVGAYGFRSVMPGAYLQATGYRPAHLHYRVSAPGFATLVTQIYFAGDPYLAPNDSCTTCGSDDPARIIALAPGDVTNFGRVDITLAPLR